MLNPKNIQDYVINNVILHLEKDINKYDILYKKYKKLKEFYRQHVCKECECEISSPKYAGEDIHYTTLDCGHVLCEKCSDDYIEIDKMYYCFRCSGKICNLCGRKDMTLSKCDCTLTSCEDCLLEFTCNICNIDYFTGCQRCLQIHDEIDFKNVTQRKCIRCDSIFCLCGCCKLVHERIFFNEEDYQENPDSCIRCVQKMDHSICLKCSIN